MEAAKKFLKKDFSAPFPVLTDPEKKTMEAYGVLSKADTVAQVTPAVFIIDKQGKIRLKYVSQDFADRTPVPYLLEVLEGLNVKK